MESDHSDAALRVLVATAAHVGDDARIAFRQIGALLDEGIAVVYVAPEPATHNDRITREFVRRARDRARVRSWVEVVRAARRHRRDVDVIIVHDLELVLPVRLGCRGVPLVWDVHEDVIASVGDRRWIPTRLRRPAQWFTGVMERYAMRQANLILAEDSYVERLGRWPVVPNSPVVPDGQPNAARDPRRVIYVGRLSKGRGVTTIIDAARLLGREAEVVLVGRPDDDVVDLVRDADAEGVVTWRGPLPNPEALDLVAGSAVGLSLLQPLPNYLGSMPTKLYEYYACAVPVVTTPLPLAADAVEQSGAGVVVPFRDADATADAVLRYLRDPQRAVDEGSRAREWVRTHHNWRRDAKAFVEAMRAAADGRSLSRAGDGS